MNYEEMSSNELRVMHDNFDNEIIELEDEVSEYETQQCLIRKALRDRGEDL